MKIKQIIIQPLILLQQFVILWFFGIMALGYALSLTDTFSALIIWIGGGMCFGALSVIKDLFSHKRGKEKK